MATIPKSCLDTLDKFFANKTIHDVNRDSYLICNLNDNANKVTVCLVFLRDWDSLESDSFNQVIIEGKGAVFQFPCYWVSVPKELTMGYITYIIETFYEEYVSKWVSGGSNSTSGSTGSNSNTGSINSNSMCGCTSGFINPHPPCNLI